MEVEPDTYVSDWVVGSYAECKDVPARKDSQENDNEAIRFRRTEERWRLKF
jgi:hypothetical protein